MKVKKEHLRHNNLHSGLTKRLEDHEEMLKCQISASLVLATTHVYSQTEDVPPILKKAFTNTANAFLSQQFIFVSVFILKIFALKTYFLENDLKLPKLENTAFLLIETSCSQVMPVPFLTHTFVNDSRSLHR